MNRSASFRFSSFRILFTIVSVAVLSLVPQLAFAQRVGGGHADGGASSGGTSAGGHPSGGGNFGSPPPQPVPRHSPPPPPQPPPPAPHYAPPPSPAPAQHFAPPAVITPPRIAMPANNAVVRVAPGMAAPVSGYVPPSAGVRGAPVGNRGVASASGQLEQHLTIGFPSGERVQSMPANSAPLPPSARRPGLIRRIFGDGRQIWSEPADTTVKSPAQTGSRTPAPRGPAGYAPPSVSPPVQTQRMRPPVVIRRGFGTYGIGTYGFGSTYYFGSPYAFGNQFFFGDPFLGFQVGSVWVPCNSTGGFGFLCLPYNYDYGNQLPYTSIMSVGTDTGTQTQEIFSPYSPALPPAEGNSGEASPNSYVLFLKDGSVYLISDYWFADGKLIYVTGSGQESIDFDQIDMQKTLDVNAKRGMVFTLRTAQQAAPAAPQADENAPASSPAEPAPTPPPQQ